jgi:uncharacterized membrane protein
MNETSISRKSKLFGILSMSFGIGAIVLSITRMGRGLTFFLAIAAIVLGSIELNQLNKISKGFSYPDAKKMAISGVVLGSVSIVLFITAAVVFRMGFYMPGLERRFMNFGNRFYMQFHRGLFGKENFPLFGRFGRFR